MPHYPHERIGPLKIMSLTDFVLQASRLYDSDRMEPFVRFVLAGREVTDLGADNTRNLPTTARIAVSAELEASAPGPGQYELVRDIDSAWGMSQDLPFRASFAMWVFPPLREVLTTNIHLKTTITHDGVSGVQARHKLELKPCLLSLASQAGRLVPAWQHPFGQGDCPRCDEGSISPCLQRI